MTLEPDSAAELASAAAALALKAHRTLEPLHAIAYFAPEPTERYAELGLKGQMRSYFPSRAAPLGRASLELVVATFFNFSPALVAKAIPAAWDVTTPEALIAARYAGTEAAYQRILGDAVLTSDDLAEAASLAREATTVLDPVGRPLFAAYQALPWPEPVHLQLFHAQTLLREHRGDGHIAALLTAGEDALDALIGYCAHGIGATEAMIRATRGWTDEEWAGGIERARARGLITADDQLTLTPAGLAERDLIEAQTNARAAAPYQHLGEERTNRLRDLARPWSKAISDELFGGGR
jgi:hypothetical protein